MLILKNQKKIRSTMKLSSEQSITHTFCVALMKLIFCVILFSDFSLRTVAQNDSSIYKSLEMRDESAGNYEIVWDLKETTRSIAKDPQTVQKHVDEQVQAARKYAQESKITDETGIQSEIKNRQDLIKMMAAGGNFITKCSYTFTRNKGITHLSGSRLDPQSKINRKSHEYYGSNWAMYFDEYNKTDSGIGILANNPIVLGTKGSSLSSMVGLYSQLKVFPEEFCALIAINPLKLHSQEWKRKQVLSNGNIVYQAKYLYSVMENQCELILDPKIGYAPTSISISSKGGIKHYDILNYTKRNGVWIPSRVNYIYKTVSATISREWTLNGLNRSNPIEIKMFKSPIGIADLRLKGDNLDILEINKGLSGHDSDLVGYDWNGKLPTIDELKLMKTKQDSRRNAIVSNSSQKYLLFIPGILLIGLGVFLKLRKSKIDKINGAMPKAKA